MIRASVSQNFLRTIPTWDRVFAHDCFEFLICTPAMHHTRVLQHFVSLSLAMGRNFITVARKPCTCKGAWLLEEHRLKHFFVDIPCIRAGLKYLKTSINILAIYFSNYDVINSSGVLSLINILQASIPKNAAEIHQEWQSVVVGAVIVVAVYADTLRRRRSGV